MADPTTILGRCLAALEGGPATTRDLADELAWPVASVSAIMSKACSRGLVRRTTFWRPRAGAVNMWHSLSAK